jgi:hypothetical protein
VNAADHDDVIRCEPEFGDRRFHRSDLHVELRFR